MTVVAQAYGQPTQAVSANASIESWRLLHTRSDPIQIVSVAIFLLKAQDIGGSFGCVGDIVALSQRVDLSLQGCGVDGKFRTGFWAAYGSDDGPALKWELLCVLPSC